MKTVLNAALVMREGAHLQGMCTEHFSLSLKGENVVAPLQSLTRGPARPEFCLYLWTMRLSLGGGVLADVLGHLPPSLLGCHLQLTDPQWAQVLTSSSDLRSAAGEPCKSCWWSHHHLGFLGSAAVLPLPGRPGYPMLCVLPHMSLLAVASPQDRRPWSLSPQTLHPHFRVSEHLPAPARFQKVICFSVYYSLILLCVCVTFETDFVLRISFRLTEKWRPCSRVPAHLTPDFSCYPLLRNQVH